MNRQIAIIVMTVLLAFTGTAVADDQIIGSGETYTIADGETYLIQSYGLTIEDGGILVIESGAQLVNRYSLRNYGTINNYGDIDFGVDNHNYGVINNYGNITIWSNFYNYDYIYNYGNIFNNAGIVAYVPVTGNDVIGGFITYPPRADAGGPYTATVNVPITLDASGSFDSYGTIVSYEWSFGGEPEIVNSPTITHTYASAGIYDVSLSVLDDRNEMDNCVTTVTVTEPSVPNPDQSIPEFPTIALPIAAILGLAFIIQRRKE
jgi:PKD repeat protein